MKIAICGKMGTGKTYFADYITKKYDFRKASFAKRLKTLAEELFDMTHKDRGLLINFATKMREIDSRVWIKAMFRDIKNVDNVVLDDLRLNNEYITLKTILGVHFLCFITLLVFGLCTYYNCTHMRLQCLNWPQFTMMKE